jgi:hypothetical protein
MLIPSPLRHRPLTKAQKTVPISWKEDWSGNKEEVSNKFPVGF